jgi:Arc/MetJ family transcription regulator
MVKRLIDIEDGLLDQAREALGTSTIKETVAAALQQAIRSSQRRARLDDRALQRFSHAAADLSDENVLAAAWR